MSNELETAGFKSMSSHKMVIFFQSESVGLKGILAIHNNNLGPSLGGIRMLDYPTDEKAINDALNLSETMSYKSALAGIKAGGAKMVLNGSPELKTPAYLEEVGKYISGLAGLYWCGADVNINADDLFLIAKKTSYVTGLSKDKGGSGDPSPYTAYGVFKGIKAAVEHRFGDSSLKGKRVMVQGLGRVGQALVELLEKEEAIIYVNDIRSDFAKAFVKKRTWKDISVVGDRAIFTTPVEVFAPCAIGGVINDKMLKRKCQFEILAGGANNPLQDPYAHSEELAKKGVLYMPDFLINSGGVIHLYYEMLGVKDPKKTMQHIDNLYGQTQKILQLADKTGETPFAVSKMRALELINLKKETIGK